MGQISSHFVGMSGGLLMSVIAFSIVFLVIMGLMLVMMGTKMLAQAIEGAAAGKPTQSGAAQPGAAQPAGAPARPASPAAASPAAEDEGELVAVITAAIAAMCGAGARVVSVSPAGARAAGSPWRMTGRLENSEGFAE